MRNPERQERGLPENVPIDLDSDGELRVPIAVPVPDGERNRNVRRWHNANTRYSTRFSRSMGPRQHFDLSWNNIFLLLVAIGVISLFSIPCAALIGIVGLGWIAIGVGGNHQRC